MNAFHPATRVISVALPGGGLVSSANGGPDVVGTLACSAPRCSSTNAVACAYVDRRGRQCRSAVCPQHQHVINGSGYCSIHAETLQAVGEATPTDALPDVGNVTPALVSWIARDLHDRIVAVLFEEFRHDGKGRLVLDGNVRLMKRQDASRFWMQSWRVAYHNGIQLVVAVEVDEGQNTQVVIRVDQERVIEEVPPWLMRKESVGQVRDTDDYERAAFFERCLAAIAQAITRWHGRGPRGGY
jgi:hypothetical protein